MGILLASSTEKAWGSKSPIRQWCDRVNATYKKHIRAIPKELYAVERPLLKPLPAWLPEVYRLHHRLVDVEATCRCTPTATRPKL